MKSLTILKSSSAPSTKQLVRLYHQSQLEWSRHLGEETELDFGRWIHNADLPLSDEANCLLDAFIYPGITPARVIAESRWRCCTLNPSMPPEQTAPLADALVEDGWHARSVEIWHRARSVSMPIPVLTDLTLIPARASYRHYQQLMERRSSVDAAAALLHLDDSHFDVLLAIKSREPVACIGVLTTGDVGTIREWFVSPDHDSGDIDPILLDRALEICARSMHRNVLIDLTDQQQKRRELCQSAGFEKIGGLRTFYKHSCI